MNDDENADAREVLAVEDDPWLGVNLLTEFVFCPRAGIIELQKERQDDGEDEQDPRASVSYMPPHELSDIVQAIERTTRTMMRWLPVPIISLVVTIAAGWWLGWCPAVTGLLVTMCLAKPVFTSLEELRKLKELHAYAESRKPVEPDPSVRANQEINWWELRKAGFMPAIPPRGLEDENARLIGRPWRILTREGMQIPVFKKRIDGPNPREMRDQHYARMAAYCHLLEHCTGADSPYGIVLFGYTFEGVAINSGCAWPWFREGLLKARRVVREMKQGDPPAAPPPGKCRGCPHGKPFVNKNSLAVKSDHALSVVKTVGADGREYRSDCGERFGWIPPHEKAAQKELRRA